MKQLKLVAKKRTTTGRHEASRARKQHLIPGIVYGDSGSLPLFFEDRALRNILQKTVGHATLIELEIEGEEPRLSVLAEFQRHPIKDGLLHIDFHEVSPRKKMSAHIPVRLIGAEECIGTRLENGVLEFPTHQLEIRCLPKNLPEELVIDISDLHTNKTIHIKELKEIPGVEFSGSPELTIVSCSEMKVVNEVEMASTGETAGASETSTGGNK